jgi:hemerythrin-like domain-containing protein
MPNPPNLLNDDGSASMATLLMMSHHAFRRDIARFAEALRALDANDEETRGALRDEWQYYRNALHHHHTMEDSGIFPDIRARQPELGATVDALMADHQRIDPLLEQGDRAFAELPSEGALAVVEQLASLLMAHLSVEEAALVPCLREARGFPPPATEEMAEMYAQGFAWSSQGIAAQVLEPVYAMLPDTLRDRLPSARQAFDDRCVRVWGSAKAGSSLTPIPSNV